MQIPLRIHMFPVKCMSEYVDWSLFQKLLYGWNELESPSWRVSILMIVKRPSILIIYFIWEFVLGDLFCPGSTKQSQLNESKTCCCWEDNFTSCFRYFKCIPFNLKHVKINENHCRDNRHHNHTDGKQNWSIYINQNCTFARLGFCFFVSVILSVTDSWTTSIAGLRMGLRIVTVNICWLTEKSLIWLSWISLLTLLGLLGQTLVLCHMINRIWTEL